MTKLLKLMLTFLIAFVIAGPSHAKRSPSSSYRSGLMEASSSKKSKRFKKNKKKHRGIASERKKYKKKNMKKKHRSIASHKNKKKKLKKKKRRSYRH